MHAVRESCACFVLIAVNSIYIFHCYITGTGAIIFVTVLAIPPCRIGINTERRFTRPSSITTPKQTNHNRTVKCLRRQTVVSTIVGDFNPLHFMSSYVTNPWIQWHHSLSTFFSANMHLLVFKAVRWKLIPKPTQAIDILLPQCQSRFSPTITIIYKNVCNGAIYLNQIRRNSLTHVCVTMRAYIFVLPVLNIDMNFYKERYAVAWFRFYRRSVYPVLKSMP